MKHFLFVLFLVIGIGLTTGCSILPKPPATGYKYFVLQQPLCATPGTSGEGITIRPVAVADGIDGKRIMLVRGSNQVGFYQYAAWLTPPARTLTGFISAMAQCEKLVGTSGFTAAHVALTTDIKEFDHVIINPPGEVKIIIDNSLSDALNGNLIRAKRFSMIVPVDEYSSPGAVKAFQTAIDDYIGQLKAWIRDSASSTTNEAR